MANVPYNQYRNYSSQANLPPMNPDPLAQNENNNNFPNPIALTPDSAFQPAEEKKRRISTSPSMPASIKIEPLSTTIGNSQLSDNNNNNHSSISNTNPQENSADSFFNLAQSYERNGNYEMSLKYYKIASDLGHAEASLNAALSYEQGLGVEKNLDEMIRYLEIAAEQGNQIAYNNLGNHYELNDNYELAIHYYQQATDHEAALYSLAKIYFKGEGVEKNLVKSAELFLKSAKLGNDDHAFHCYCKAAEAQSLEALCLMGQCYESGTGIDKEPAAAVGAYEGALQGGYTPAAFYLGLCHMNGIGTEVNMDKAVGFFEKIAGMSNEEPDFQKEKSLEALFYLGKINALQENTKKALEYFEKFIQMGKENPNLQKEKNFQEAMFQIGKIHAKERNYEKALECYEKADKHPEALYELSKLYRKGKGTDKDENRGIVLLSQSAKIGDQAHAHKCHKKLAALGDSQAMIQLGLECRNRQNYEEGIAWFFQAAAAGNKTASYYLGLCHELGQGVPQNDSMAAHYYQQADSQKDALYRLALLYMTGRGVSQNVNTAISLLKDAIEIAAGDNKFEFQCLKLASDLGDAESTNNLGILYEQGNHEVIQNYQLAIEYYWKAAQRGFENAWYNLGHCFEEGTGVPQNFLFAKLCYMQAPHHDAAVVGVARLMAHGHVANAGVVESIMLLTIALLQGNSDAQAQLDEIRENLSNLSL